MTEGSSSPLTQVLNISSLFGKVVGCLRDNAFDELKDRLFITDFKGSQFKVPIGLNSSPGVIPACLDRYPFLGTSVVGSIQGPPDHHLKICKLMEAKGRCSCWANTEV